MEQIGKLILQPNGWRTLALLALYGAAVVIGSNPQWRVALPPHTQEFLLALAVLTARQGAPEPKGPAAK